MKNRWKILVLIILVLLLIAIREVVAPFLYDPLANYFKSDYLYKPIPSLNLGLFFVSTFIRYFLNSVVSISIIYLFFNDIKMIFFASKLYLIVFIILIISLVAILKFNQGNGYLLLFYVRRILIHPILLLLLLPAFYFQKLKNLKN
jgi:exosortase F-associated protein